MQGTPDGVFDRLYLGRQTREPVDFVGALNEVKKKLADPVWLEIGPSSVCSSFIRATIFLSLGKLVSSLQTNTDPWASISECLVGFYQNGMAIDWLALHSPVASGLKLMTIPSYAWDLKDYWITYTEKNQKEKTLAPAHGPTIQISTCAQYVVQESTSPELAVTLGASMASPAFNALIDGHRIRGVSIVPGSVFCDAGLAAAKYALQFDQRTDAADSLFIITDINLTRPLTRSLIGSGGELLTTATRSLSSDRIRISWKASSTQGQYNLGTCVVAVVQKDETQSNWQRISYFVNARMNELISTVKGGHGHRMLPDILYALFSNTVEYDLAFKCIQEAFISSNFEEAVAEVILRNDPEGTQFAASPYWGETLVHLAGFLVNSNPSRLPTKTTFMMDSFGSFEQTATFAPGKAYFTYVRVSNREKDTTGCDVYVFDAETLVMQCSGLRFQEVSNDMLDRLLGKRTVKPQTREVSTKVSIPSTEKPVEALEHIKKAAETPVLTEIAVEERKPTSNTGVFEIILESIAKAFGTMLSELTDDMELAELGVDSIMGIEIAARANSNTDSDIPPSFMMDYPTIGDLRNAFTSHQPSGSIPRPSSDIFIIESAPESTAGSKAPSTVMINNTSKNHTATSIIEEDIVMISSPNKDDSPTPSTRVILIQGRPSSEKRPLYLITDGTGSIATYIHLPLFSSKIPIYGIDSPYLRCPSRWTTEVGIAGAARIILEALVKIQPKGSFSIGGFSGGAMVAYEVCRQLAAAGRSVDGLLLIDMCCPRPCGSEAKAEVGWRIYESTASQAGGRDASNNTQQHLRAFFTNVAAYHPPPITEQERPKRTVNIWAKKGLIDRCSGDVSLVKLLAKSSIPTEPFPGFMEAGMMGAIAWGLPHKTDADLGPNGWDKYVGKTLCLSVDVDHLEIPMPQHVNLLHGSMEEAFEYFSGYRI